jgi:hypothetical protein
MRCGTFCLRKLLGQVLQDLTDTDIEPDRGSKTERTPFSTVGKQGPNDFVPILLLAAKEVGQRCID